MELVLIEIAELQGDQNYQLTPTVLPVHVKVDLDADQATVCTLAKARLAIPDNYTVYLYQVGEHEVPFFSMKVLRDNPKVGLYVRAPGMLWFSSYQRLTHISGISVKKKSHTKIWKRLD